MSLVLLQRHGRVGALILLGHGAALWALQAGLGQRPPELVVPVSVLAQVLGSQPERAVKQPAPSPRPPLGQAASPAQRAAAQAPSASTAAPSPAPVSTAPSPLAPAAAAATVATSATAAVASVLAGSPAPSDSAQAAAPAARVELPTSSADYLNNPKPVYPPASRRMGEQGLVVVRVLIGADGQAQRAELRQSSGFERLDQAALATTLKWRYVPGRRAGVPEAMWFNVPINFVLE